MAPLAPPGYDYGSNTDLHRIVEAARSWRRRMRDAPQTGCALRIASMCVARTGSKSKHGVWFLLLLAVIVCPCRWDSAIATKWCCDQDVKAMSGVTITKGTCDRCGFVVKRGGCWWRRSVGMALNARYTLFFCHSHFFKNDRKPTQFSHNAVFQPWKNIQMAKITDVSKLFRTKRLKYFSQKKNPGCTTNGMCAKNSTYVFRASNQ